MSATVAGIIGRYRDPVIAEMRAQVGDDPALLYHIVRYHLGWDEADGRPGPGPGGKLLRPVLCLLAAEATATAAGIPPPSGQPVMDGAEAVVRPFLPAAAAIELIHNFSLVHDDIEDQDARRHGRSTAWTVWGVAQAINAGDGLWALANRALLRTAERGVPADLVLRVFRRLTDACLLMIEGQAMDLSFEERRPGVAERELVSVDEYLSMIGRKTGALLSTALAVGALLGSGSDTVADQFHAFGAELGRMFQIQDDVLGIWGDAGETGKSTSSDLLRRKQSYPVVYTLTQGPSAARRLLAEVYAAPELDGVALDQAVAALNEAGAREQAAGLANAALSRAMDRLAALPITAAARDEFSTLAGYVVARQR